jgi:molybdopterin converting factor small subunit
MPQVWVPALMRDLTGGAETIDLPGETVRQVIESFEARCPGAAERLLKDGRLNPTISVVVDGVTSSLKLRQPVSPHSQIYFVIAISGG